MPFALAFWILMLVWFAFGLYQTWPNLIPNGGNLLLFILLGLLGWHAFGPPIHG